MFVPAHALAGFEAPGDLVFGLYGCQRGLESAGKKRGTVLVGRRKGLLFAEVELPARRIVGDVTSCGLRREPFANVALGSTGFFRQLRGSLWPAGRQRFVQSEPIADADQSSVKRGAEIDNGLSEEFVQLIRIDCHDASVGN